LTINAEIKSNTKRSFKVLVPKTKEERKGKSEKRKSINEHLLKKYLCLSEDLPQKYGKTQLYFLCDAVH
jgi:hypothetical protein